MGKLKIYLHLLKNLIERCAVLKKSFICLRLSKMASNGSPSSSSSLPANEGSDAISSQEAQAVVKLSMVDGDFNPKMRRGEYTFVHFMAPWCDRCRTLDPKWELLSRKYPGKVKVAEVDCTQNRDLCSRYKIQGYPTLILFKDGKPVQEYQGGRDLKSLSNFIEKLEPLGKLEN